MIIITIIILLLTKKNLKSEITLLQPLVTRPLQASILILLSLVVVLKTAETFYSCRFSEQNVVTALCSRG